MDEYLKPNTLIAQNYPGWLGGVHPSGAGWREGWSQLIGSVEPNGGTSIAFTQLTFSGEQMGGGFLSTEGESNPL